MPSPRSAISAGRIEQLLDEAIAARAFPGAALVVSRGDATELELYAGSLTYKPEGAKVIGATMYDLASLTKVISTTALAMILWERAALDLESRLVSVVPEFRGPDPRREQVTLRHLLAHSSGLPAHRKYFQETTSRKELLASVFATPLEAAPGTLSAYSDVGFILLGLAIERTWGETLDTASQREIFSPLALSITFGPLSDRRNAAPTLEAADFRHKLICGEVNDENAWMMGGVAAHAGLFGTALDVSRFARCLLGCGTALFNPLTVAMFTERQTSPAGTSRALGWDTPGAPSQAGKYFSRRGYGHLGYTGTSLWIDPEKELSITLLTNRTYPDNSSQEIRRYRPLIHDAVIEILGLA